VAVQVDSGDGSADGVLVKVPAQLRRQDFAKLAAPLVPEELRRHLIGNAPSRKIVDVPIGNEQIGPAIQVGIEKLSAESQHGKTSVLDARASDGIGKQTP